MKRNPLIVALLVLPLGSCQGITRPDEFNVRVSTAESVVTIPPNDAAVVAFSVTNQGRQPIFLSRCGDRITSSLTRREGEEWEEYSGDMCLAIYLSIPLEVAPGQTVHGARAIHESGTYRLQVGAASRRAAMPQWTQASNSFAVE